jgi:leucyl aminopeptidase
MSDMQVTTYDCAHAALDVDVLLLPVFQDADGPGPYTALDDAVDGRIAAAMGSRPFTGKARSCLAVPLAAGAGPGEIILVGLGKADDVTLKDYREAIASAVSLAARRHGATVAIAGREEVGTPAAQAGAATEAALLSQYRFTRYKPLGDDTTCIDGLRVAAGAGVVEAIERAMKIATAVAWARDLINTSPSDKRPPAFAQTVADMAAEVGLECEVIDAARARDLEMGALLAVGRGSSVGPRLVVLEHAPAGTEADAPIALVGKGVTFDTGGISIKPSASMDEMKADMSGAAAVAATMRAIATLELPRRVVGLVPMAENMPDGDAYRPGDLVTAMNGKVIEVLNTDAEGRMILADALAYAVREYAPKHVVDLATLTGACVVALGEDVAGVMTNDDKLAAALVAAGTTVAEPVWPLPMFAEYDKLIESKIGDIKNTGGRWGGAITAAKFLENFVDDTSWAHLDIAGPAYRSKASPLAPRGGVGFGVRLLVEWLGSDTGR